MADANKALENGNSSKEQAAAVIGNGALSGAAKDEQVNIKDIMKKRNLQPKRNDKGEIDDRHPLRRIAFSSSEDVVINRGRFSWFSALNMSFFIVSGFTAVIFMVLSMRNTAVPMVSEELSYIDAQNPPWPVPPWGYVKQPGDASSRTINKTFRYAMPQTSLFYSLASASFGLFTVAYFCSEMLVQDRGVNRVKFMGDLINMGVDAFLYRTVPILMIIMLMLGGVVYFISDYKFVIAMLVGSGTCMTCSNMGINMNFEGGPRLTHQLNYDLPSSINLGVRTGAIAGLSAHAMAQLGTVGIWMSLGDASALVGFALGSSIVAFYQRVGGGIFAKGSDIGSDFVAGFLGEDVDDYNLDALNALREANQLDDKDGDGEVDGDVIQRRNILDPNAYVAEEDIGFITEDEAKIRANIEKQMEATLSTMHPVNYLDAIGENIADVGGTCSDLFETMSITLATAVILGSKAHDTPYVGTSLPFNIISTGTLGCTIVSYWIWAHERHSSNRILIALRLNLLGVMVLVQGIFTFTVYLHWNVWHTISYARFQNYSIIVCLGLCAPEICAMICEFFTSVHAPPVRWLAQDANLGTIQVILQGLGQGFLSAGAPSTINILVQILAFRWEGFYGLVLLACASQACTGWQATLAAYGAVGNNACRMAYLTTANEVAHHRGNVLAAIGTTTSHTGKCVGGQNCFFATTALLGCLIADKYTKMGKDFQETVGQELAEFTRAGLLAGIVFTLLFLSNTLTSCIKMAKMLVVFVKNHQEEVAPRVDKQFPATHILPLKALVRYVSVESFQLTFAPMVQTFFTPLVIGQLFGFKGLLMLVSGGNSVCFSLNMFLINSGQAWDAARKYVTFGMLRDKNTGQVIGAESEVYDTLEIGEQIGGPLEDLTGPALNNFIKLVAVVSFVTSNLYDEFPYKTWPWGCVQVVGNFVLVSFFRWGLRWTINHAEDFLRRRKAAIEEEEGTQRLKEIEEHERLVEQKLREQGLVVDEENLIAAK